MAPAAIALCLFAALLLGVPRIETAGTARAAAGIPLFVESAAATGLNFTHVTGESGQYYMAEQMGAGVALFDYDNDGDLDVFSRPGRTARRCGRAARSAGPSSRLFRNDLTVGRDGKPALRFTDVTERAGVALRTYGMGAAVGDYDNDGFLDLFVTGFGAATLFHNNGDGTFADVTAEAGVADPRWSTSAAFLDYDRDGHLDLFVARLSRLLDRVEQGVPRRRRRARLLQSPRLQARARRALPQRRQGALQTTPPSPPASARRTARGSAWPSGDYNGDGWPDVYVANDATPNQLWINRHDGTFSDEGLLSGAAVNAAGNPEGSMGIASGDFDADGDEDLFVTNIIGETFALYTNDGKGNFEDTRTRAGLAAPTAPFTGFGTDWFDYDNDGRLDLFVANGAVNVIEAQRGQPRPFRMRNQLFHNAGDGRFTEDRRGRAGLRQHARSAAAPRSAISTTTATSTWWRRTTADPRCCC